MSDNSEIVVHTARRIITMENRCPDAEAVAVRGDRIVAVGPLDDVLRIVGDAPHRMDDRFAGHVLVPGFIEQHLHPLLGAATLTTAVIATETWELPDVVFPAASDPEDYWRLLRAAETACPDGEWLFSWGYHSLWHGPMTRSMLDEVSPERPIAVWQRSCHEFFLNSAAIAALGITADSVAAAGRAGTMVDLAAGHWWETGTLVHLLPRIAPVFLTRDRFRQGLTRMVAYLHANGVTALNEPGSAGRPSHGTSTRRSWARHRRRCGRRSWSTDGARPTVGWTPRWPWRMPNGRLPSHLRGRSRCSTVM